MKKLLQLSFVPRSTDFALLLLRVWLGLSLLVNHGWMKIANFSTMSGQFLDPLHIGTTSSLVLSILAEALGALCLILGFATRFAALIIVINLGVAFIFVHHLAMSGPHSGELAYAYLGGALTILFAGGGRFVVCRRTNDLTGTAPAAS